ncbi:hypothetical protein VTL71DRAFT_3704 [Oculimacula yallundae]|uniref:Uncharacterized protein n=1 Tax=Oculimacula yallundae TaxID=86028 RepID=A0ABR4C3P7_9HELO
MKLDFQDLVPAGAAAKALRACEVESLVIHANCATSSRASHRTTSNQRNRTSLHSQPRLESSIFTMAGFVNRENRVPHYQRMFQQGAKQHVRQWNQTPKSKMILYPYYAALFGGLAGTINVHDGQTHPGTQDMVRKELDALNRRPELDIAIDYRRQ